MENTPQPTDHEKVLAFLQSVQTNHPDIHLISDKIGFGKKLIPINEAIKAVSEQSVSGKIITMLWETPNPRKNSSGNSA